MEKRFENKVVLITGASSGIGAALVREFIREGATVIGAARNLASMQELKKTLPHPDKFHALQLDLEMNREFDLLAKNFIGAYGKLDILVNNGGISQRANAADTSADVDRKIMEVNYFGNIALAKAFLPYMKKQKSGSIVVLSSIAGKFGFYLRSAYSASKHALHGFYESLRLEEEGNGIHVMMVCPGKVATNISVNALTGKGATHQSMDKQTEDGVSAGYCAHKIIEGLTKGKEEILIGRKEIKAVKLKRLFPKLFGKVIRKQARE